MSVTDTHTNEHPDFLAHHWDTPTQQFEAGKLGMWLFLATEVLLFGGLFVGYSVWRSNHPDLFAYGSSFLDTKWGAINTVVLIASSFTMAFAVTAAQRGNQKGLIIGLVLTLAGAFGFLGIKYNEYSHKINEGWLPGPAFYDKPSEKSHTWNDELTVVGTTPLVVPTPDRQAKSATDLGLPTDIPVELSAVVPAANASSGLALNALADAEAHVHAHGEEHIVHALQRPDRPANAHMFFTIYYLMTGLHGIHVVIGIFVISWLLYRSIKGEFGPGYFTPIDLGGLYWHIVDLIWIFLFPLFYLI